MKRFFLLLLATAATFLGSACVTLNSDSGKLIKTDNAKIESLTLIFVEANPGQLQDKVFAYAWNTSGMNIPSKVQSEFNITAAFLSSNGLLATNAGSKPYWLNTSSLGVTTSHAMLFTPTHMSVSRSSVHPAPFYQSRYKVAVVTKNGELVAEGVIDSLSGNPIVPRPKDDALGIFCLKFLKNLKLI